MELIASLGSPRTTRRDGRHVWTWCARVCVRTTRTTWMSQARGIPREEISSPRWKGQPGFFFDWAKWGRKSVLVPTCVRDSEIFVVRWIISELWTLVASRLLRFLFSNNRNILSVYRESSHLPVIKFSHWGAIFLDFEVFCSNVQSIIQTFIQTFI